MGKQQTKSKRRRKKNEDAKKKKGWRTAATSDIQELYELSVQEPESEIALIDQVWSDLRNRDCVSIREDFCGTAQVCMAWAQHGDDKTAVGVDLDPEVLNWGRARIPERLTDEQASRVTLIEGDVRTTDGEPVDSVCAMNFSYYLFRTREDLRNYFKSAYKHLKDDGLFLLDAYGGSEAFAEIEEERHLDGFTYVWEQHKYSPVTGEAVNYIHFRFPDGSEIDKAFSYPWRLWTLPEIQEVLIEAGFSKVTVYWEGSDEETGEGNGEWTITDSGEACEGWIAYLVAEK